MTQWPASVPYASVPYLDEALASGVREICRRLGLTATPRRYPTGSLPVYAIGDVVLKLYPPEARAEWLTETAALRGVQGRLPVRTPGVHEAGELDGWHYLLMDRLPGEDLSRAWRRLTAEDRLDIGEQVGRLVAALHGRDAPLGPPDWPEFVAAQRASCVERQAGHGLAGEWLAQLPDYLAGADVGAAPTALLHTEVMPEHLLVRQNSDGWRLTGLFDFEPAMRGAPEYEFVAIALFLTGTDAALLRHVLLAYGYPADALGPELARRLLAWTLLHRYGKLAVYLRHRPGPPEPTLESLAQSWFRAY